MSSIRVLLVDDQAELREALCLICQDIGGFTVVGAAVNGVQAVTLARTLTPDVILMDIMMPEMDGIEATRRIMAADGTARIVTMTASSDAALRSEAMAAGARGLLPKPVDVSDLLDTIDAVSQGAYRTIEPRNTRLTPGKTH